MGHRRIHNLGRVLEPGYYPSRNNALCPALSADQQIDLPVFRMLGSDPVTQYDMGLDLQNGASEVQPVASLEPVYRYGGGDPDWDKKYTEMSYRMTEERP